MLELRHLSKRLGDFHLREVSLTLAAGEYVVVLGPSGVGKTVLLEVIAGLTRPDAGQVLLDGLDLTAAPPEARQFALMYQDYALFPHLTVSGNIAYGLHARRRPAAEVRDRVARMAARIGIGHLLDRYPETLSGGEQQRVALARALVLEPRLVLLDEPLAALDAKVRGQLRRLLKELHQDRGTAFIHVTHDPDEALYLADRVGVMLAGTLHQTGTPEAVFQRPTDRQVAEFLGLHNVLRISAVRADACVVQDVAIHVTNVASDATYLWIRPEEIILSAVPFRSSARNQFQARVTECVLQAHATAVHLAIGDLPLVALITPLSCQELGLQPGGVVHCTFKSTAVHCFGASPGAPLPPGDG